MHGALSQSKAAITVEVLNDDGKPFFCPIVGYFLINFSRSLLTLILSQIYDFA